MHFLAVLQEIFHCSCFSYIKVLNTFSLSIHRTVMTLNYILSDHSTDHWADRRCDRHAVSDYLIQANVNASQRPPNVTPQKAPAS